MRRRCLMPFMLAPVIACASSGSNSAPPGPEIVNRVYVPGGGGAEMFNEPGVGGRTVPLEMDLVWGALPEVYDLLGVPEASGDRQRLLFGNPGYRARRIEGKRLSTYIDCGAGATAIPNADQYDVTMTILTQLARAEEGEGTLITTTLDANARPRAHTGNPVHCQSEGTLEMRVTQLVMWVLLGGETR